MLAHRWKLDRDICDYLLICTVQCAEFKEPRWQTTLFGLDSKSSIGIFRELLLQAHKLPSCFLFIIHVCEHI